MEKATIYFLTVLGLVMLGVALLHIGARYVIGRSLPWSEEFLRIAIVWFAMLSATLISKRSEHIGIVVFREHMPMPVQKVLVRLVRFVMLIACCIVTYCGVLLVIKAAGNTTPALGIPYSLAYAAIPLAFFIMVIYEVSHIIKGNFMETVPGKPEAEESSKGSFLESN